MKQTDCFELEHKAKEKYAHISALQNEINDIAQNIQQLLPKGCWYSYDIDTSWKHPKKYSIKNVEYHRTGIIITVKEAFKKKPWPGFTGEHFYDLHKFFKLNIHKTENEAIDWYTHRICPKCGGLMGYSEHSWCVSCMSERRIAMKNFNDSHKFYEPIEKHCYTVEYVDELTRTFGYNGQSFTIRRKDTGEIIRTNNLWSHGYGKNTQNLPEIEFIKENANVSE